MSELAYLDHLRSDSARFLDVLAAADPSARVPSCPDWDAGDLLWHLTGVQWFWASIVEGRLQSPEGLQEPDRPGGQDALAAMFAEQSARLHSVLSEADPAEPVYMWAEDKTVGYIRRRQAHEALIHRLDAELTTGQVTPLDSALASDGVHEALDVMFGRCPPWGTFTPNGTQVEVRVDDTGLTVPVMLGSFFGTDPDDGETYDEDTALSVQAADPSREPAATVSGSGEDLDAWLWHRRDGDGLTVRGDSAAYDFLVRVVAQPMD